MNGEAPVQISKHCVKSVCIRSYSSPYFPAFGPNTNIYGVPLRIQSEYRKIRSRITPNADTFYAVKILLTLHPESTQEPFLE